VDMAATPNNQCAIESPRTSSPPAASDSMQVLLHDLRQPFHMYFALASLAHSPDAAQEAQRVSRSLQLAVGGRRPGSKGSERMGLSPSQQRMQLVNQEAACCSPAGLQRWLQSARTAGGSPLPSQHCQLQWV
jgi:hypothetical protein